MKVKEARRILDSYDGEADVQICVIDEEGQGAYFDVKSVQPLIGAAPSDAIFELGDFRCG